ncbi:type III-A CRISPR-associated protein Csm2 [uncultured Microscilla sp.]|uniref:type III-A CRISPR-associated protein Csm2 n=1 Tax=uncultured Microscilla sp. TaxID=432653 RepID=UPI0026253641|nr:type III-A CRISPR-associated protein Csm2 [uncultured Microscilla sp.]
MAKQYDRHNKHRGGKDNNKPEDNPSVKFLRANLEDLLNMKESNQLNVLINHISDYVKVMGKDITASQLRNIFAKVKKLKKLNELHMLRPQLAYISGRLGNRQDNAKEFLKLLDEVIQKADDDQHVRGFSQFFEAIVAYHKSHHSSN